MITLRFRAAEYSVSRTLGPAHPKISHIESLKSELTNYPNNVAKKWFRIAEDTGFNFFIPKEVRFGIEKRSLLEIAEEYATKSPEEGTSMDTSGAAPARGPSLPPTELFGVMSL